MYEMICVDLWAHLRVSVVCAILESVALIEASLEELPVSAIFGSALPSNKNQSTLLWVVPPHRS